MRLVYVYYITTANINTIGTATTMLWWSMLEVSLAAIAACLPTLSFLFKDISVWKLYSRLSSSGGLSGSWHLPTNRSNKRKKSNTSVESQSNAVSHLDSNDTPE